MQLTFSSLSGLSIERLNTFCRVAEFGSIKDAADADPTRQSQYSRQIKELEIALEVTLFDRSGKKWVATEHGRRLLVISRSFFEAIKTLQTDSIGAKLHLRIGSGDGLFAWYITPRLERMRPIYPRISFECRNLRTAEIIRQLSEGEVDIGIVREDAPLENLTLLPFTTIDYSLFVPRQLLPGKSAAGIELLRELPMAKLAGLGNLRRTTDTILQSHGIKPINVFEAGSFILLTHAMNLLSLSGIVPSEAKHHFSDELFAKIDLEGLTGLKRKLVIAFNPEMTANNANIEFIARQLQGTT